MRERRYVSANSAKAIGKAARRVDQRKAKKRR
jgi:hypothetical protein